MKSLIRLVFLVLLLTGWGLAAASLHVLLLPNGFIPVLLVPRAQMASSVDEFKQTYLDTRAWTLEDAARYPQVIARVVQTGHAQDLSHLANPRSSWPIEVQLAELAQQNAPPSRRSASADDLKWAARLAQAR